MLPPLDWSRTGRETWAEVVQKARERGLGAAVKSLAGPAEQRRAFWEPLFREIRQPVWWMGDDQPHPAAPHQPASTLEEKLAAGAFVVTSEVAPPLSVAPDELTRTLNILRDYIDAANFTDNPSATPRMSSLACSALAIQQGVEPVMQVAARDRTRMGLQAEILGAAALGVRNVLCLTGDHPRLGPAPHGRMDIWDLDSIQMLWILRRMRDAKMWLDGRGIANPPRLFLGAAASPCASTPGTQAQRELKKSHAGAQFFQSNLVYDVDAFEQYLEALDKTGALARTPFLVGITPIRSARAARMMTQVPGIRIPETLIGRLETVLGSAGRGLPDFARDHRADPPAAGSPRRAHHGRRVGADRAPHGPRGRPQGVARPADRIHGRGDHRFAAAGGARALPFGLRPTSPIAATWTRWRRR